MLTFLIAYLIVWLAVLAYVVQLGTRQRRLLRSVESLQARLEQSQPNVEPPAAKAA